MEKIVLFVPNQRDLSFDGELLGEADLVIEFLHLYKTASGKIVFYCEEQLQQSNHAYYRIYDTVEEMQNALGFSDDMKQLYAACNINYTLELA